MCDLAHNRTCVLRRRSRCAACDPLLRLRVVGRHPGSADLLARPQQRVRCAAVPI